jgi:leucyl aminopeptidase
VTPEILNADSQLLDDHADALPLWLIREAQLDACLEQLPEHAASWLRQHQFRGERLRVVSYPDSSGGRVGGAVLGLGALASVDELTLWHAAPLSERLPPAAFRIAQPLAPRAATQLALGWLMGRYRLQRYRCAPVAHVASVAGGATAALVTPPGAEIDYARAAASASALARDLINTPANDLGPEELANEAAAVASYADAAFRVIVGEELLSHNYPLIYAVGAASVRAPRLIDFSWGRADAPKVTLVGKGVCFDSGGLDLKPSAAMLLMKKDMGGAACVLALARLLMQSRTPIRLRVLIPAVDNSIAGNAYRPGDVLRSRKGLSVEIGNTDAEGRLVLADALTEADGEAPELLIDLATLTGAARTALGPELPAAYSNDERLLAAARAEGEAECDPVWPMPLWSSYDDELGSRIADLNNVSTTPFAGSIIAALFLRRFVVRSPAWLHLDLYAWNAKDRPGRPVGAEAQCVRMLYRLIRTRFG